MSKKVSRIIATIMLVLCILFVIYALNNPQASFPWGNGITYAIYGVYFVVMIILYIAPFKKQ